MIISETHNVTPQAQPNSSVRYVNRYSQYITQLASKTGHINNVNSQRHHADSFNSECAMNHLRPQCLCFVKTATTLPFKSLPQQTNEMHCILEMIHMVFAGPLGSAFVCVLQPDVLTIQKVSI